MTESDNGTYECLASNDVGIKTAVGNPLLLIKGIFLVFILKISKATFRNYYKIKKYNFFSIILTIIL